MMLLEPDKSRARIHLGIPVLGIQDSGYALGIRFEQVAGLFEYRANNLQPWEYTHITGYPAGALAIMGNPVVGNTISATVGSTSQVTYTVTSQDLTQPDPTFTAAYNFCVAFNAANGASFIASPQPSVSWPQTTQGAGPKQWQITFVSTTYSAFTLTTSSTGLVAFVISNGVLPKPSVLFQEDQVQANGYLAICDYLESKTAQASDLLKFSSADVTTFRPNELQARDQVYYYWRKRLSDFLGIPLYPVPPVNNGGGNSTGGFGLVA